MTGSVNDERLAALERDHQAFLARHAADMASLDEVIAQVDAKLRATWDTITGMSDTVQALATYFNMTIETLPQRHIRDSDGDQGE